MNNYKEDSQFNNQSFSDAIRKADQYSDINNDQTFQQQKDTSYLSNSFMKVDIRLGDSNRQNWTLQDRFQQKTPTQSLQTLDIEVCGTNNTKIIQNENFQNNKRRSNVINQQKKLFSEQITDLTMVRNESQASLVYNPPLPPLIPLKGIDPSPTSQQSKIYKSRNTVYRKNETIVDTPNNKKKKQQKKSTMQNQYDENNLSEYDDGYREMNNNFQKKQTEKPKIWLSNFFNILFFVNRFYYRNKLKLIHHRPQYLLNHQIQAINDIAYPCNNEGESRQIVRDTIFRSQYKIIRKIRIMYLLFRKKMKLFIIPITLLQNKFTSLLRKALDPIPVILPYHNFSLFWDLLLVLFILINVIKIPFEIAFNNGGIILESISNISKLLFLLDIFMLFNTAYYENGVLEKQRSKIFIHFLKNRLILEILAYVCLWINPFGISLFRIVFLIKFFTFYGTIEKLAEAFQLSHKYNFIINLIVLLIEVMLLCHLFACIWYSIGNYQQQNNLFPNWIQKYGYNNDGNYYSEYIVSIYFSVVTIGTIGYGDINPQSLLEKGFLSGMAIFSCGIFAYILSNIQNVYREYMMKQEVYLTKLTELNSYMFNREVNPTLQQMARKYLKYVHEQGFQQGVMPCDTLNSLSKSLREEIKEDIYKKSMNCIPFFNKFSQQLRSALSTKMTEINFGPDEIIMKCGQVQQPCLYYILKGQVEICLDKGLKFGSQMINNLEIQPFSVSKSNDIFGLYEFVSQSSVSMTNAKSIGVTTVHVISLNDFLEVMNKFSIDKEKYHQFKDSINLYKDYECINLFCYSCKSSQHLIKDCPIFFHRPVKQKVINQFNKELDVIRKGQARKEKTRFNSLQIQKEVEDDIKLFRDENESDIESLFDSQSDINDKTEVENGAISLSRIQSNLLPTKIRSDAMIFQNRVQQDQTSDNEQTHQDKVVSSAISLHKQGEQSDIESIEQIEFKNTSKGEAIESRNDKNYLDKITNSNTNTKSPDSKKKKGSFSLQLNLTKSNNYNNLDNSNIPNNNNSNLNNNLQQNKRNSISQKPSLSNFEKNLQIINSKVQNEKMLNIIKKMKENSPNLNPTPNPNLKPKRKSNSSQLSLRQNSIVSRKGGINQNQIQNVLEMLEIMNSQKERMQTIVEEQPEDITTDTMRTFRHYMVHNNIGIVIRQYNASQFRNREKLKIQQLEHIASNIASNIQARNPNKSLFMSQY